MHMIIIILENTEFIDQQIAFIPLVAADTKSVVGVILQLQIKLTQHLFNFNHVLIDNGSGTVAGLSEITDRHFFVVGQKLAEKKMNPFFLFGRKEMPGMRRSQKFAAEALELIRIQNFNLISAGQTGGNGKASFSS